MLAMSVLTLVLTSGGVQRGLIVKKPSKNTSVDVLNLDEGSIPFTRFPLQFPRKSVISSLWEDVLLSMLLRFITTISRWYATVQDRQDWKLQGNHPRPFRKD